MKRDMTPITVYCGGELLLANLLIGWKFPFDSKLLPYGSSIMIVVEYLDELNLYLGKVQSKES